MSAEHTMPNCIGIILDGNRRWAREKGLPTLEGHRRGAENLKIISRAVRDRGIQHLAVYLFSTENWKRSEEEVSYLFNLLREYFKNELEELRKEGIRVRVAGQRERFPADLQEILSRAEAESSDNPRLTLWACLSYGGRAEIVAAARTLAESGKEITEESLTQNLWTGDMPDPDLVIRASGEVRLSNFLTWKSVYSEWFFIPEYWPDFTEATLDRVLGEYAQRQRRHGG
jgi:undecaprenyl diphosphate synthase